MELAANEFQMEHGRAITSLWELVPEYLEDIPLDPWGGKYILIICDTNDFITNDGRNLSVSSETFLNLFHLEDRNFQY